VVAVVAQTCNTALTQEMEAPAVVVMEVLAVALLQLALEVAAVAVGHQPYQTDLVETAVLVL
jgi:hypothetical protein